MVRDASLPLARVILLVTVSIVASLLPLPLWLGPARPAFLSLTLLWFVIVPTRPAGLLAAWLAGLLLDLLQGNMLGQNALAMVVMAAIALKFRLQVRNFPPINQAAIVGGFLFLYEFLMWTIDGFAKSPSLGAWRWIYPLTSALFWPVVYRLHERVIWSR